jgi:predicted peroxiredoxin
LFKKEKNAEMSAKKILYVQTSGVDTPECTYAPFIATLNDMAIDADTVLCFWGALSE